MQKLRFNDRGKALKKLKELPICPVTNGLPTTMTLESFKAACSQIREQERHGAWDTRCYQHSWCDIFQGKKLPKELRVLSLDKLKRQRAVRQYMKSREMRQHSPAW